MMEGLIVDCSTLRFAVANAFASAAYSAGLEPPTEARRLGLGGADSLIEVVADVGYVFDTY